MHIQNIKASIADTISEIQNKGNHLISSMKEGATSILQKLKGHGKTLGNKQTDIKTRNVIAKSDTWGNNPELKINYTNAKESWQKGLIDKYNMGDIKGWVAAVTENITKYPDSFNKIFSKEQGIFKLDKLSSKDLTTIISKLSSEKDALSFCKSLPDIKAKEIFNKNANDINQNDVVRMRLKNQSDSLLASLKPLSESYRGKIQIPRKKFEMTGENKVSKDELDKILDELHETPVAKKIINSTPKLTPPPTNSLSDKEIDELLKDLM